MLSALRDMHYCSGLLPDISQFPNAVNVLVIDR